MGDVVTGEIVRWTLVGGALILGLTSVPGIIWAELGWDQRLRFATMLGYGVWTAGGQLDAISLARPSTPWTWLGVPVTILAVASTVAYVVKRVPDVRAGGDREPQ